MPLTADVEGTSVVIQYDLGWLFELMLASSNSMVGFSFFTEGAKWSKDRSYPRSFNPGFTLKGEESKKPFSGGRETGNGNIYALFDLLASEKRLLPLSDVAILSKRAVCTQVHALKPKLKHLKILGGTLDVQQDVQLPPWPIHGYPMLCVMGRGGHQGMFDKDQGEWRVAQCVFGAVLTREIRKAGIGLEVVSREGFGSLFPTLADLPSGIRLDPGLLPPDAGAQAIATALQALDEFIETFPGRCKKPLPWIGPLNGMTGEQLAGVDRLMSSLHAFTLAKPSASGDAYAERVASLNGGGEECGLPLLKGDVFYALAEAVSLENGGKIRRARRKKQDKDGYGSESDYEDEVSNDDVLRPYAIKKYSVVSGMAALRMATLYGMAYSAWLFNKGGLGGKAKEEECLSDVTAWAPYFELDHEELSQYQVGKSKVGVRALLFDAAPNPINIPGGSPPKPVNMGAIIIDTTNNTSMEKAEYIALFRDWLAQPLEGGCGGVVIMVDSASKHPTGGDLVHGVMRVFGTRKSTEAFYNGLLAQHLKLGNAYGQTALSGPEDESRKMMNALRLVMRNRDLWQWLED